MQKVLEIRNFALSLHSQLGGNLGCIVQKNAEIAQLVEHNLAKVGVASSSLVFRSKSKGWLNASLFVFRIIRFLPSDPNAPLPGVGGVNIVREK